MEHVDRMLHPTTTILTSSILESTVIYPIYFHNLQFLRPSNKAHSDFEFSQQERKKGFRFILSIVFSNALSLIEFADFRF